MHRSAVWLVAGTLVAIALVAAFLGRRPSDDPQQAAPELSGELLSPAKADKKVPETGGLKLARVDQAPSGPGARLLADSDGARRNLLTMSIRDAGHDCPEVRSAEPLAPSGDAWRAYCGALRLYWIEIDEFGRISVEPGAYNESEFGIDTDGGGRTLTIRPEDMEQLQEVK